jgi:hypothetical protein
MGGRKIMLKNKIRLSWHWGFRWQILLCVALSATTATSSIAAPVGPPKLNVGRSCEAAAQGAIVAGRNKEACMADERTSQEQIIKDWSKYASADKTDCVGMNRTGGSASYVELLTCLETLRDAKLSRKEMLLADPLLNNGQLNTRTLNEGDPDAGGKKLHRGHKRKTAAATQ